MCLCTLAFNEHRLRLWCENSRRAAGGSDLISDGAGPRLSRMGGDNGTAPCLNTEQAREMRQTTPLRNTPPLVRRAPTPGAALRHDCGSLPFSPL